jgi:hypothetical protein
MDISHDHTDFGPQIPFLSFGSTYFLHLYTISDRLMGDMTYVVFEPLVGQPRDPTDSKFFGLRKLNIKLQSILRF